MAQRRGKKIARLTLARLMLRSVYKMLRDGVAFEANRPAKENAATATVTVGCQ